MSNSRQLKVLNRTSGQMQRPKLGWQARHRQLNLSYNTEAEFRAIVNRQDPQIHRARQFMRVIGAAGTTWLNRGGDR